MTFYPHRILILSLALLTASGAGADTEYVLSHSGCGRATGYSEANKIVTFADKTHVAWLDSNEAGFEVKARTLDHSTNQWSATYTIGPAQDNHGGPSLAVDSEGYLHVVYYPHSSPMRYRRSLRPNDASRWGKEIQFGDRLTYPTLVVGPDDTLYLTARRRGAAEEPWSVEMYSKPEGGKWSAPTTIIRAGERSYSQFQEALAWGPDHKSLHLSVRMYGDTPRWGYLLGYMTSDDFGRTWKRHDGTPITLPADKESLDAIEIIDPALRTQHADASSLRGSCIAVNHENRPFVLYNKLLPHGKLPRQAWIAMAGEHDQWHKISLNDKIKALPKGWGLGLSGGLVFTPDGKMNVVLTAADDMAQPSLWGTESSEVIWAESTDSGRSFTSRMISRRDPSTPHWLPNIEKPTGFNQQHSSPSVIYLSGARGDDNHALLRNNVIFWNRASEW